MLHEQRHNGGLAGTSLVGWCEGAVPDKEMYSPTDMRVLLVQPLGESEGY